MWAADRITTRARVWRSVRFVVLATLAAGCAIPLLERGSSYPGGWPAIAGAMADCSGMSGTFANKGVYIDKTGDTQEIWLTNLLPLSERTPPGDPRHKERAALQSCERVTLRFVLATDLGQIGPDVFHLSLGLGTDGSLIAKWEYGPAWSIDHVWARFVRWP